MLKKTLVLLYLGSLLCYSNLLSAEPLALADNAGIMDVLETSVGKRITVRTTSGAELSGKLVSVNDKVTHLGELTGKEFYDAVIVNRKIEAVIVRTK